MRHILLAILLSISASVSAQNAMFIPFGQTGSQVGNYLETRDYATKVNKDQNVQWTNKVSKHQTVQYFFEDNILYSIEDLRIYQNKKEAERVEKTCLDYMKLRDKKLNVLYSEGGVVHYAIASDDRVIELIVEKGKRNQPIKLRLKTTSRLYGPRMATEKLVSQVSK